MKQAIIHFITGGQRSGKSVYAEKLTLLASHNPIYLATSRVWDEGLRQRIEIHKQRRTKHWTTIEEKIQISKIPSYTKVVLLDCITQWLLNIFEQEKEDKNKTIAFAKKEFNSLLKKRIIIFAVSNEIGMGLLPEAQNSRHFIDVQGEINQYIAGISQSVTFLVSGIPLKLKS